MVRAVVDVGSNSVLLVVGRQDGTRWEWVHESTRVTALGEGTKSSGLLAPAGVANTLAALREFWTEAQAQGADTIWAGATMAARIATNQGAFLEAARAQGTPVFVLSGEDEATLGFLSVAEDPTLATSDHLAIIDPGGHSTEIVIAKRDSGAWKTTFHKSFPFGALGLRENFLTDPSPSAPQRLAAMAHLDASLEAADLPPAECDPVVLGATGTNLVSIRDRMETWQPDRVHGATLLYEEVGRAVGWLCDMDDTARGSLVGIEKGRERTIHSGSLILERALYALRASACKVSVHGWRHALASHPEFVPATHLDVSP